MYVILGATGNTGSVAAEKLLKAGRKVRAVGRSAEKLENLKRLGAEIFIGDVEDPAAMLEATKGASAVYALIPPNMQTETFSRYQNVVSESVSAAVQENHVKHVILLSSIGAELSVGNGPIAGLHRFENRLRTIPGLNVLFLRPGFFMENLFWTIPIIKQFGILGSAAHSATPLVMVSVRDVAEYAAKRLLALDFSGVSAVYLCGPRKYSYSEATKILGAAIGQPELHYVQASYEDVKHGMIASGLKEELAGMYVEMYRGFNDGIIKVDSASEAVNLPTTLEEFSVGFAHAFAS